jgi:hypothetical protein
MINWRTLLKVVKMIFAEAIMVRQIFICSLLSMFILSSYSFAATIKFGNKEVSYDELPDALKKGLKKVMESFGEEARISFVDEYSGSRVVSKAGAKKPAKIDSLVYRQLQEVRKIKVTGTDTISKQNALNKMVKIGINICNEAGYPIHSLFALRIDSLRIEQSIGMLNGDNKLYNTGTGDLIYNEYFRGIRIEDSDIRVWFFKGRVEGVKLVTFAMADPIIEAAEPNQHVLSDYVAKNELATLRKPPVVELRYVTKKIGPALKLILCWKITFSTKGTVCVLINATTGEKVNEWSPDLNN